MDAGVYQRVLAALQVLHNPSVSQPERNAAQAHIESFKESETNVVAYSLQFLRPEEHDIVRHFGLHLLEHVVKSRWNSCADEQKNSLKTLLLQLLRSGTKPLSEESHAIKEKIAALFAMVAMREWPQKWSDLTPQLFDAANTGGDTQTELVLLVYKAMAEELTDFEVPLAEQRRKDLVAGLHTIIPSVYEFCQRVLSTKLPTLSDRASLKMADTVLKTLQSFLEWAPVQFAMDSRFLDMLSVIIKIPQLQLTASECLLQLVSVRWKPEWGAQAASQCVTILGPLVMSEMRPSATESAYNLHKRWVEISSELGDKLIQFAISNETMDPVMEQYAAMLVHLTSHPSLVLSTICFNTWQRLFKDDKITSKPFASNIYAPLLSSCAMKALRDVADPENPLLCSKYAAGQFSSLEFEDRADFMTVFSNIRSIITWVLKHIAKKAPQLSVEFITAMAQDVMTNRSRPGPDEPRHRLGFVTMQSETFVLWEAASHVAEIVMTGIPSENFSSTAVATPSSTTFLARCEQYTRMILEYSPPVTEPVIMTRYMHLLGAPGAYYKLRPDLLSATIDKLCSFALFRLPSEAGIELKKLCDDTEATRRKACTVVISICEAVTDIILPGLPSLTSKFEAMFASGELMDDEVTQLTGALVQVSNGYKSFETQTAFLDKVLSSILAEWSDPLISTHVLATPLSLLAYSGLLDAGSDLQSYPPERAAAWSKVRRALSRLFQMGKRSHIPSDATELERGGFLTASAADPSLSPSIRHPFTPHVLRAFPHLFLLIRSLHGCFDPAFIQTSIPPHLQPVLLNASRQETDDIMGRKKISKTIDLALLPPVEISMEHLKIGMWIIREQCYAILGETFSRKDSSAYTLIPDLPARLADSIFTNIQHVDHRYLRSILRNFFSPYAENCPKSLLVSHVGPFLAPLWALCVQKVRAGWAAVAASKSAPSSSAASKEKSAEDEVLEEDILRDLTHELMQIPTRIFATSGSTGDGASASASAASSVAPLVEYILSSPDLSLSFLSLLTLSLEVPDSPTIIDAIVVTEKAMPLLLASPFAARFETAICNDLLVAALRTLMSDQGEAIGPNLMGLIRDIYVSTYRVSTIPSAVLSALPRQKEADASSVSTAAGESAAAVLELNRGLEADGLNKAKSKALMRKFLQPSVAAASGRPKKASTILNLSEKLVLFSKLQNTADAARDDAHDLSALFGS